MTNKYREGVFNYQCETCKSWFHGDSMILKNPYVDKNGNLIGRFVYICHSCAISELNHRLTTQGETEMKQIKKEDGITVNIQIDGPMNDSVQVITPDVVAASVVEAVKKAIKEQQPTMDHDCNKVHDMNSCIIEWVEKEIQEINHDKLKSCNNNDDRVTQAYFNGMLIGHSNVLHFLNKRF